MKKLHCALICLLALTLAVLSAAAAAEPIETGIRSIQKYGTLELTVSGNSLLEMGYEYGDIVTVTIDGKTYDMPVVSSYNIRHFHKALYVSRVVTCRIIDFSGSRP